MKPNKGRRIATPRGSMLVYELLVTTADGRDIYDFDLARFAPKSVHCLVEGGSAMLQMTGPRRAVLTMRSRILRKYPKANVRVFEVPSDAHEGWAFATEGDFVASADGRTFVVPGDPQKPPSATGSSARRGTELNETNEELDDRLEELLREHQTDIAGAYGAAIEAGCPRESVVVVVSTNAARHFRIPREG